MNQLNKPGLSPKGNRNVHDCIVATPQEAERLGLKISDIYLMVEGKLPATPEQLKLCRLILTRAGSLREGYVLVDLPGSLDSEIAGSSLFESGLA